MNKLMLGSREVTPVLAKGNQFKLFQHQWFDYEINDMSWLRSDTFSWQDGTVYSNAYNHLVADIDGVSSTTETIGGYTVTFYRTADGHKIVLADHETTVDNIYTATGVAWYYVLDTINNRFKLPRTKYNFNGLRGNVGDYIPESLPNITGEFTVINNGGAGQVRNPSGAFRTSYTSATLDYTNAPNSNTTYGTQQTTMDASRSSSTYQNDASVQQRGTQQYLYFYVGQFSQSAIEQTAGLNAELFNNKIDINGNNVITEGANKILNTSSYTTNRILEIPQDIKFELANNALKLKTGSKLYRPNGFEADGVTPHFDTIITENDLTAGNSTANTISGILITNGSTFFELFEFASCFSGNTAPTGIGWTIWWDTANNIIKLSLDGGSTWDAGGYALPPGTAHRTLNVGYDRIEQVFNGFGGLGSILFALPGTVFEFADKRNPDGTCKSVIATLDKVLINSDSTVDTVWVNRVRYESGNFYLYAIPANMYYNQRNQPISPSNYSVWFDVRENTMKQYFTSDGWISYKEMIAGSFVMSNGKLASVTVPEEVSKVNTYSRSEISQMSHLSNRYEDWTLLASGSSYRAPANGKLCIYKIHGNNSNNEYITITVNSTRSKIEQSVVGGVHLTNEIDVEKGDLIIISYNVSGSTTYFRFFYDEGEI